MALDAKQVLDKALKLPLAAKAGILFGVYLLLVGLYYVAYYTDQVGTLKSKTDQYEKVHAQLVQTQSVASQIDQFIAEVDQLKEKLAQAQDQLPPEARLDVLVEQITRIGKDNGLTFNKITPKPEVSQGFYSEIPIEFEVTGKYHPLALFFRELAGQARIMNVRDLETGRDAAAGKAGAIVKGKFSVVTYRSVSGQEAAASGAKPAGGAGGKGGAGKEGANQLKGGGADKAAAVH